jgi:ribosomal protein L33
MPEIATYRCNNYLCRLTLRLSRNFPVWLAHTPYEVRLKPRAISSKTYIERLRSESYCRACKKVVEYTSDQACASCASKIETEQLGAPCPRCQQGVFTLPQLSIF